MESRRQIFQLESACSILGGASPLNGEIHRQMSSKTPLSLKDRLSLYIVTCHWESQVPHMLWVPHKVLVSLSSLHQILPTKFNFAIVLCSSHGPVCFDPGRHEERSSKMFQAWCLYGWYCSWRYFKPANNWVRLLCFTWPNFSLLIIRWNNSPLFIFPRTKYVVIAWTYRLTKCK